MEIGVFGVILLYEGSDGENRFSLEDLRCLDLGFLWLWRRGGSFTCEDEAERLSRSPKCNSVAHGCLCMSSRAKCKKQLVISAFYQCGNTSVFVSCPLQTANSWLLGLGVLSPVFVRLC